MDEAKNNDTLKTFQNDNKTIRLVTKKTILLDVIKSSQNYLAVIINEFTIYKEKRKDSYKEVVLLVEKIKQLILSISNKILANKEITDIHEKFVEIDGAMLTVKILIEKCRELTQCLFNVLNFSKWKEEKRYMLLDLKYQWNQKIIDAFKSEKIRPSFLYSIETEIEETKLINDLIISWADSYSYITEDKKFKDEFKKQFLKEKFDITCKKLNNSREISMILLKNKLIEEKYHEQLQLLNTNPSSGEVNDHSIKLTDRYQNKYSTLSTILNYDFDLKIDIIQKAYETSLEFLAGKLNNFLNKELLKKRTVTAWFNRNINEVKTKVENYLDESKKVNANLLNEILETASKLSQVPYIKK